MEESITQIVSDLENLNSSDDPLSESTLLHLQTLFDNATNDPIDLERLSDELSSKNLSLLSLVRPITSTMDSNPIHLSILASKIYLSLILSPNAPVFTLFKPMSFLSLLRSIRRSFKNTNPGSGSPPSRENKTQKKQKKRGGGRGGPSRNQAHDEDSSEERRLDIKVLFSVLDRLELVLGSIHLDRFPDSLKSLIQTVAEIPVIALEVSGVSAGYNKFCDLCSRILSQILRPDHGDQAVAAAEVLKSLTPLILRPKSQAKAFALSFVVNRMMNMARDSEELKKAIVNLPKYLVHKAPEKSEPRASAVESILEIVKAMEYEDQVAFTDYVVKMSLGKSHLRLLAIDLILMLMTTLPDPLGLNSEDGVDNSWGLKCLEALIERCSDTVAGIRAKALTNLAQLVVFLSGNNAGKAVLKEVTGFGNVGGSRQDGRMNDLLRRRCTDEKAAVRKSALLLVSKLTSLLGGECDELMLKTMGVACSDPLVSIRKAAVSALSEAFRTFSNKSVTLEWLHSVPRLVSDNESSIQEECESLFLELVLDRVSRVGCSNIPNKTNCDDPLVKRTVEMELELLFPEGILGLLEGVCDGEVTPWVKKICASLGKKKRLKPKLVTALQNIISTSESVWSSNSMPIEKWTAPPGAWLLLSEVSAFVSKSVDWKFLIHHWQLLDKYAPGGESKSPTRQELEDEDSKGGESKTVAWAVDRVFLLQTISNVSIELPPEAAADLAHDLLKRIEEFNMESAEVNAHVKALRTLCKRKAKSAMEADALVTKWVNQLLLKASKILEIYLSKDAEVQKDSTFFTPPRSGNKKERKVATAVAKLLSQAIAAVNTVGSLVIICPSADLKAIIPLLHTIITSENSSAKSTKVQVPSTSSIKQTAPSLYIQAWLTMGKICLADDKLAKRYIPLFVQELEKSDCAALRNNIVVMMADFCIRYTALVDCYIPKITKCLRDPCELVRRQTFVLLSRLLQRDYVKWRGVLFLRFLLSLVDESNKIRQLADFLFGNILKAKAPLLAYNSFVEAIFVLNNCTAHSGHANSHSSKAENRLFSIKGTDEKSRSERMHIYVSLLKQMAPEHLLATFAKVCAEILASVSDGMLNIDDITGQSVLQDAFQVLASKEIRITKFGTSEAGDLDEDGGEGGAAAAAKGRVITQAVKKGLIQNTIPIFIELKRLLESKNSPLTGSLMECLRALLKDYKNEIDEILIADKQLQKELIYDMQKYESLKAKTTAAEAVATMQRAETYRSPGRSGGVAETSVLQSKITKKLKSCSKVASAIADAAAEVTARSVLREVNRGILSPLGSMSVPRVKSMTARLASRGEKSAAVLESIRRRQSFDSDDES